MFLPRASSQLLGGVMVQAPQPGVLAQLWQQSASEKVGTTVSEPGGGGGGGFMPAACWRLCLLQLTEQRQIQTEQASSGGAPSAVRMSPPARSVSNSYVQLAAGAPCVVPLTMPGEGVATQSVAFCGSRGSAAGSAAWLNLGVCTAVCWQHGGTPAHTHSRG